MKRFAADTFEEPPGVDTRMSTVVLGVPAGATARMELSLRTVKESAGVPPKVTE